MPIPPYSVYAAHVEAIDRKLSSNPKGLTHEFNSGTTLDVVLGVSKVYEAVGWIVEVKERGETQMGERWEHKITLKDPKGGIC